MRTILFVFSFLFAFEVYAHGDAQPQAVDTSGLESLGDEWLETNPYSGNEQAIKIGEAGYTSNCARCHGLGAVSGGISPDLRELESGEEGDEWFMYRVRSGAIRNGVTYMPPFEGLINQEAMWAIRSWIETIPAD
ncbi:MAG: cytochrome c-550 PedF [Cycloclasticus sp.]|nr:cytochrome c-550 PedF [Cycloclasticus sp.]MBG96608.1 cytochrome c-550 PedF [Cycloclasticus sp.]HAI97910.1 cytochrome c-550 PedF [Methylococcaceae bacterium]|tara:strand:- start:119 stop:523 length:405 start_codon:yes stop_codon:yes gene_type:complete